MKVINVLYIIIFLSNGLLSQEEDIVLIGEERLNILEKRYYVFTITSNSSIIVEAYKKSKGQICYFDLFGNNIDSFTPELISFKAERVSKDNKIYLFSKKGYLIKYHDKEWIFCRDGIKVELEFIKKNSNELNILRNSSLLTFAFYSSNVLLDIERELTYDEQLKIKKVINGAFITEAKEVMKYDEFQYFLLQSLRSSMNE